MPNFDGTGPNGQGKRTGRGKGNCNPMPVKNTKTKQDVKTDESIKIAITSTGKTLDSTIDSRFARCAYFIIYNTKDNTFEAIENPAKNAMGGAAAQATEIIANAQVKKVVSGNYGPRSQDALESLNIEYISVDSNKTIQEIIEQYK